MMSKKEEIDFQSHWEKAWETSPVEKTGWYEQIPAPSLELIESCQLDKKAVILNVGAGATTLVDELVDTGYDKIIANDISASALEALKKRLGKNSHKVTFVVDDLVHPAVLTEAGPVDLWHDRAVLHFFNKKEEQDAYFKLLRKLVKPGGYVIIAVFNLQGATKCSGLPVFRYDQGMLAERLGEDFKLIKAFDYTYTMPSGDTREYIYTLFKRHK
ncbi:MAG: class I SAM-dependent methyltransferase [Cyclobacteriaceae bacterium]|nr:class I SAM-dependent methyltransferase [Cyclobacteriaceae bacterium]